MSKSYIVIGGEGFVGSTLVRELVKRYPKARVASLDIVQRKYPEKDKWTFRSVDLTDLGQLSGAIKACRADVVFHTASPAGTGSNAEICEKVNVRGTQTVVDACLKEGVSTLVFTSSAGVVYNGEDLINVDERLPVPEKSLDPYNVTKAKAEEIVLKANGQGKLKTVAIRPAGIYGPGDRQALPGFLDVLKSGKTGFQIGSNQNLFDWTYVDNIVHAHILAAERIDDVVPVSAFQTKLPPVAQTIPRRKLPTSRFRPDSLLESEKALNPSFDNVTEPDVQPPSHRSRFEQFAAFDEIDPDQLGERGAAAGGLPVAGQAFIVTGGEPTTFWNFPRALWYAYDGHEKARVVVLPPFLGLFFASVGEFVAGLLGKTPNLTRGRVVYSTVYRFYNIEKARRMLGYEPVVGIEEGIKRSIAWYKENEAAEASQKAVKA